MPATLLAALILLDDSKRIAAGNTFSVQLPKAKTLSRIGEQAIFGFAK